MQGELSITVAVMHCFNHAQLCVVFKVRYDLKIYPVILGSAVGRWRFPCKMTHVATDVVSHLVDNYKRLIEWAEQQKVWQKRNMSSRRLQKPTPLGFGRRERIFLA